jgi:HKD family nuclease
MKYLNAKRLGTLLPNLITKADEMYWAVAWATDTPIVESLIANKGKMKQLVVGVDFAQTSPVTLKRIHDANMPLRLGNSLQVQTTFHPKIYAFTVGDKAVVIIGSSNFTNGGLDRNEEASVLIEESKDNSEIQKIFKQIENWWRSGKEVDEDFLKAYKLRWEKNKAMRASLGREIKSYIPRNDSMHPNLLTLSWLEYKKLIAAYDSVTQRLAVLEKSRLFFATHQKFSAMSLLKRRAIAGVASAAERNTEELGDLNWGFFGSMRGLGVFPSVLENKAQKLDEAFSHIPLFGDVDEEQYKKFVANFQKSFDNKSRVGGLPPASRLLAMIRPDQFVCVDSANRDGLAKDLGFAPSTLNLENYWSRVIEPIRESTWWNAKKPESTSDTIWMGRAALLDVIYYQPQ